MCVESRARSSNSIGPEDLVARHTIRRRGAYVQSRRYWDPHNPPFLRCPLMGRTAAETLRERDLGPQACGRDERSTIRPDFLVCPWADGSIKEQRSNEWHRKSSTGRSGFGRRLSTWRSPVGTKCPFDENDKTPSRDGVNSVQALHAYKGPLSPRIQVFPILSSGCAERRADPMVARRKR